MIAAAAGAAAWHDVECASYAADLPLWRELANDADGEVLDLGCGTGRVALDLAAQGHRVTGLDSDRDLVKVLAARARERSLDVTPVTADARSFDLGRAFALAIAPMQVVQLIGAAGRAAMLACVLRHLEPGALFAAALADPFEGLDAGQALPPLPDVREEDGWVLSSTPVAVRSGGRVIEIDRHRQAVSPAGELTEQVVTIRLATLDARTFAAEARHAGFQPLEPRRVPETPDHVGSTIVLLEAPS